MTRKTKTYDDLLELKDAYLVASSAAAKVDSANQIIDLGAGEAQGDIIIDVSACEVASDDEKYIIGVQLSDSSTFASGIYETITLPLGSAGTAAGDNLSGDTDMTTGRWVIPFNNLINNGATKRYLRLYTTVSGTIAAGINYTAYLAQK